MTWRYCGCSERATRTAPRLGRMRFAISTASAVAEAPSYMLALATSKPNRPATRDWNSNIACSVPWLTSGWYGV